jgi:hypothetical protein
VIAGLVVGILAGSVVQVAGFLLDARIRRLRLALAAEQERQTGLLQALATQRAEIAVLRLAVAHQQGRRQPRGQA